jgi:biofilm PGA synthesis N-glycosyltransferase PgaC
MAAYVIFWLSLFLLAYVYAGYPLLAILRGAIAAKPRVKGPIEPHVSILVVGYNEEPRIGARIENLLALDYPRHRLEIVVASDGSTDGTAEEAMRYQGAGVLVLPFAIRRGKTGVVNAVMPALRGEIVLFADARQRFEPHTLRAIVENFADPQVGAVSGELVLLKGDAAGAAAEGSSFYWRYEKLIRSSEAQADSSIGATGAIYAIRRRLFEPIPDDTLLDDALIPLRIVKQGYRVLFEPAARAYDEASTSATQEFARKARTIAGTFQLFSRETWLLNPRRNRLWFATISHKGLRLLLPLLHLTVFVATLALPDGWLFRVALAGQLLFYAAALIGAAHKEGRRPSIVFSVPAMICVLSWATVVGFTRFVTNRQKVTWDRMPPTSMRPAA